ncbi:histidine kinase [Cohnella lubricantis]|uniref:sensor histidine kinase n=1 Tax=Cohnella lubricantis TaxID=2163172 RepID=UPI0028929A0E|nr:histidine kinase [Cohnella lubricantis]MBP2118049.1 sensor histidine kinase YesM [Cohnella lubricantis]
MNRVHERPNQPHRLKQFINSHSGRLLPAAALTLIPLLALGGFAYWESARSNARVLSILSIVVIGSFLLGLTACSACICLLARELRERNNAVRASKLKQKAAELRVLEEQINPHFLYNTLDMIYWMSRMEKAFETSAMIGALSQLLRIGLNRGSRLTTVAKEVELIRHYLYIQQKRCEELIRFSLRAEPETLECRAVKMVLQPIVENAIVHGIERRGGDGRLDIHIFRDPANGDLVYRIWDDGAGADAGAVAKLLAGEIAEERQGIGLRNIHDRIRLQFGSAYGVDFASDSSSGTTVTVRQPFEKG